MKHDDNSRHPSRREFFAGLAIGGAGTALAACKTRAPRFLVPYLNPPDDVVPGMAVGYRSVCRGCSTGCGLTARVIDGRAIKLEGNPDHPSSGGALCVLGQAGIEELYAPERLTGPLDADGAAIDWDTAGKRFADGLRAAIDHGGQIVVLTRPESGAFRALLGQWLTALGQPPDQIVDFDPAEPTWLRDANRLTFGVDAQPVWALASARTVVSIGADLIEDHGSPVEHARELARIRADRARRFIYVGPRLSLTAASATGRIALAPGREMPFVLALLGEVLALGDTPGLTPALRDRLTHVTAGQDSGVPADRLHDLARALTMGSPGLVVGPGRIAAGDDASALAQAVALLNVAIGAPGRTLRFGAAAQPRLALDELVRRAQAGKIGALVIHQADPLGLAPVHDALGDALAKIPFVAAIGCRRDATASRAQLVLADHHFLESWGDVTTRDGVHGFQQPVMTPLHDTHAAGDILLDAARRLGKTDGLPDDTFAAVMQAALDEKSLARGGEFTEPDPAAVALAPTALDLVAAWTPSESDAPTLLATPSLHHPDGLRPASELVREVPDTMSSIAWSGWVELSPANARVHSVSTGDELELATAAGSVRLPVFVTPGIHDDAIAIPLPDAIALLGPTGSLRGRVGAVTLAVTRRRTRLPMISGALDDDGRNLVREVEDVDESTRASIADPPAPGAKRRWALAIDLDRCNGCGACVAACYVENNSPVVGPDEVAGGRDMAWLRIQRSFTGTADQPRAIFLPVMCQQCGEAPCEPVCPSYATYHTDEGLNAQVYNRCIGTQFCSNNCPYSARRLNWYDWERPAPTNLGLNPDVTVRSRGVMEKCTFCVQRIRGAEEQAKLDDRALVDGDITPACAQTCATDAVVFGDLLDPSSRVARFAQNGRSYRLLEELDTKPGVVYLARRKERS